MGHLVIVNPAACGGKAEAVFSTLKSQLERALGELTVFVSHRREELPARIEAGIASGLTRLLAVGGDGTNHAVVNALFSLPETKRNQVSFGSLPVGTGSDWARALGMPLEAEASIDWLARAHPVACDVGVVEYVHPSEERMQHRFFLNIASAGVSGEVDRRVNRAKRRTSATFLRATIATLFQYKPQRVTVDCDGQRFFEGPSYLLTVANGRYFGRGMWVAPYALIDDGFFDVILVEGMPRRRVLLALKTIYTGAHLKRKDVHSIRASSIRLVSEEGPLSLDLDGEESSGQSIEFRILPQALKVLIHPACRSILKKT